MTLNHSFHSASSCYSGRSLLNKLLGCHLFIWTQEEELKKKKISLRAFLPVSKQVPDCQQQSRGAVYPTAHLALSPPATLAISEFNSIPRKFRPWHSSHLFLLNSWLSSTAHPHALPPLCTLLPYHSVRFEWTSCFYCCTHYPPLPQDILEVPISLTGFLPTSHHSSISPEAGTAMTHDQPKEQ